VFSSYYVKITPATCKIVSIRAETASRLEPNDLQVLSNYLTEKYGPNQQSFYSYAVKQGTRGVCLGKTSTLAAFLQYYDDSLDALAEKEAAEIRMSDRTGL
jgi:hypothetical protein